MKLSGAPKATTTEPGIIYIKREFIEKIESGKKTLELRVGFPEFRNISVGDNLTFRSERNKITVRVLAIREYRNLGKVLETEDVSKLAPDLSEEERRSLIRRIFDGENIKNYGLLVFEFERTN